VGVLTLFMADLSPNSAPRYAVMPNAAAGPDAMDTAAITATVSEAASKRATALETAGPFTTNFLADVRWLLCGRGRPVAASSPMYTVALGHERAEVFFQDIEAPRVDDEERFEELGYTAVTVPWHAPPRFAPQIPQLAELRRSLAPEELDRYRAAGADIAGSFIDVVDGLRPEQREYEVAGELARRLAALGFTTPVVLVGGEQRAPFFRHPLPTDGQLGRFALLAVTAERDGLHISMTRVVSFGTPPGHLVAAMRIAAEVDGAVLAASRPGRTLGELFAVLQTAYARAGVPDEWRDHHQGGIAGYLGREAFATPGDPTELPPACAVAWNPSAAGGGKSEDTALVTADGIEIVTRTPELGEVETGSGIDRAAVVIL
jgi:Xaa-Pro aminopeptidase